MPKTHLCLNPYRETRLWGDTDVLALYDANADTQFIIEQIKLSELLAHDFAHKIEQLEDKDWEREWMDNFHPMKFGQRLWICPSWREVPEPDAVNVMLDPRTRLWNRHSPNHSSMPRMVRKPRFVRQNCD